MVTHLICGGVYDWSTGLIYRDGRYFDPNLGLWLALTPLVVVQSWRRRKGKGGWVWILSLALLAVGVSGMVTGCRPSTPMPTLCTEIPSPLPTPRPSPVPSPVPLPTPTLSGKIAYLTFDDQPNGLTPQVLEKLRFYGNIKATFNIVGQHLDWAGSYVNDIVREGHAVGLHSMNHVIPWYTDPSYDSPYEQLTELIERVTSYGAQPQVWRAPAGVFERELPAPYNQSLYRYGWDINPLDEMNNAGKPQVIYSIYQEEMEANADDSIIILLHGWTPEALDLIIPDLIQRGYQFGVLPRSGDPIGPVIWD